MSYVGKKVDDQRRKTRAELKEYREADGLGRQEILDRYRKTLMAAAQEHVKTAQLKIAGQSTRELERLQYLESHGFNFVNGNTRGNARIKYVAAADPDRSSARPVLKKNS